MIRGRAAGYHDHEDDERMADDDDELEPEELEEGDDDIEPHVAEPEDLDEEALAEEEAFDEIEEAFVDEDAELEEEDEDEDEEETGGRVRRTAANDEDDDDEDLLAPDDVEADLDTILKDRLVAADEAQEDEEDEPEDRSDPGDRLQPKRADEQLCPSCFLLVRQSAPSCPVADDECPLFA